MAAADRSANSSGSRLQHSSTENGLFCSSPSYSVVKPPSTITPTVAAGGSMQIRSLSRMLDGQIHGLAQVS